MSVATANRNTYAAWRKQTLNKIISGGGGNDDDNEKAAAKKIRTKKQFYGRIGNKEQNQTQISIRACKASDNILHSIL